MNELERDALMAQAKDGAAVKEMLATPGWAVLKRGLAGQYDEFIEALKVAIELPEYQRIQAGLLSLDLVKKVCERAIGAAEEAARQLRAEDSGEGPV